MTVMGKNNFPVHLAGLTPARGAVLGMSFLMGSRGLGALIGPLLAAPWAGHRSSRLRLGILIGFCFAGAGYTLLGVAPNLALACLALAGGHIGGSVIWVFSTTLLQLNTEDRFRGRVFSAELGFCMFTIAAGAWIAGYALDTGVPARTVAIAAGLMMIVPITAWAFAMRLWRQDEEGGPAAEVS